MTEQFHADLTGADLHPPGDHAETHLPGGGDAIDNATTGTAGLMSSSDKTKLNGVESGATADQTKSEIIALWGGTPSADKVLGSDGSLLDTSGLGGGGGGVTDHGALTGLSDDDHPQYLDETRGDARYVRISGDPADGDFFEWDEASEMLVPTAAPSSSGGSLPAPVTVMDINAGGSAISWSNMPAAVTSFVGNNYNRVRVDLTDATEMRLNAYVSGTVATSAKLRLEYSTNEAAWTSTGVEVTIGGGSTGTKTGTWTTVPVGAKDDVYLRLVGLDGDGIQDPAFGQIQAQVK